MVTIDSIKEKADVAEEFARKIWLAGLGAYGKGYNEVLQRFEDLNSEASKVFDDLVVKGEKLESDAKSKIKEKTDFNLKDRVADVREKLGMNSTATDDKIDDLSQKIAALTESVAKLSSK